MIGGGLVGSEQGLHLAKNGHDVTIVEMLPRVANESYGMYREALVTQMEKANIKMMKNTTCLEIGIDFVNVQRPGGQEERLEADTVLYALGMTSTPFDDLKTAAGNLSVDVIGDAIKPGQVNQAISTAYLAAINIGNGD